METVTRKLVVAAFLFSIPLILISCRAAPKPLTWTVEDAGWNNIKQGARCIPEVSLALDSAGVPQVAYGLTYPNERDPKNAAWYVMRGWKDNSATPPVWTNEELHSVEGTGGWVAFRLCLTPRDNPVCAIRSLLESEIYMNEPRTDGIVLVRHGDSWPETPLPEDCVYFAMAVDDVGAPTIVWYATRDFRNEAPLNFARLEGDQWMTEKVDTIPPHENLATPRIGMTLDQAGAVHIAYCNGKELKYACKDSSGWHLETIDSAVPPESTNAIAIDNSGNPHIAYEDGKGGVMYAWRDKDCWHTEAVGAGAHPDIAVDLATGEPFVSLVRNGVLVLARRVDGKWFDEIVDDNAAPDSETSLAIHYEGSAPSSIAIAYQSGKDNNNIKLATARVTHSKVRFTMFGLIVPFAVLFLICPGLSVRKRA
jgi:hypothetical protein